MKFRMQCIIYKNSNISSLSFFKRKKKKCKEVFQVFLLQVHRKKKSDSCLIPFQSYWITFCQNTLLLEEKIVFNDFSL